MTLRCFIRRIICLLAIMRLDYTAAQAQKRSVVLRIDTLNIKSGDCFVFGGHFVTSYSEYDTKDEKICGRVNLEKDGSLKLPLHIDGGHLTIEHVASANVDTVHIARYQMYQSCPPDSTRTTTLHYFIFNGISQEDKEWKVKRNKHVRRRNPCIALLPRQLTLRINGVTYTTPLTLANSTGFMTASGTSYVRTKRKHSPDSVRVEKRVRFYKFPSVRLLSARIELKH
jgi:hypothetical protein